MRAGARHRFSKINEFLAVERIHDRTLRESHARQLASELDSVRSRYVKLGGVAYRRELRRYRLRSKLWFRVYLPLLAIQSLAPTGWRRGPWRRLLVTGRTKVDLARVVQMMIPRAGRRFGGVFLRPSRYWLEPPT
jgi:hypothetical protein